MFNRTHLKDCLFNRLKFKDIKIAECLIIIVMQFALLPNKTQVTYTKLFTMIKSSFNIEPLSITNDFELATLNAIKEVFPNTKLLGCYFHLCQSLFRNVQVKGLSEYFTK